MNNFKNISSSYTEEKFDEIDVDAKHLENAFTNKEYYLAMKPLPLKEKQVLYYSEVKNYSLNRISKIMNLSKDEIIKLKEQAITNFKENLKRICKGEN